MAKMAPAGVGPSPMDGHLIVVYTLGRSQIQALEKGALVERQEVMAERMKDALTYLTIVMVVLGLVAAELGMSQAVVEVAIQAAVAAGYRGQAVAAAVM